MRQNGRMKARTKMGQECKKVYERPCVFASNWAAIFLIFRKSLSSDQRFTQIPANDTSQIGF